MSIQGNTADFFKNIEEVADSRLRQQVEDLKATAALPVSVEVQQAFINVNGLILPDSEKAKTEVRAKKRHITNEHQSDRQHAERLLGKYEKDRKALIKTLSAAGIKPMAILPVNAWDKIRHQYGLYRFCFGADGKVGANPPDVTNILRKILRTNRLVAMIYFFCLFAAVTFAVWIFGHTPPAMPPYERVAVKLLVPFGVVAILLTLWECVGQKVFYLPVWPLLKSASTEAVLKLYDKKNHTEKLRELFPGFTSWNESTLRLSVRFPNPPKEVEEKVKLLRKHGIDFEVTAEPDAVVFFPSLQKQLRGCFDSVLEEERRRLAALLDEPIIQVPQGSAVAIVAQYGDFNLEQAAVKDVLLQSNLLSSVGATRSQRESIEQQLR